jgi:hypothetical protein
LPELLPIWLKKRPKTMAKSDGPLRDGSFLKRTPGNKLPGYLHLVPSGQTPQAPVHIFDFASPRLIEDSLSAVAFALGSRSASQARRAPREAAPRRRKNDDEDEYDLRNLPNIPDLLQGISTLI